MTLLLLDGFDLYNTVSATSQGRVWSAALANASNIVSSPARTVNALQINTATGGSSSLGKTVAGADEHATFIAGGAFYVDQSNDVVLMSFWSDAAATQHIDICVDTSTGTIRANRGGRTGTLLGSAACGFFAGQWHYVEAKVLLSDTVGTVTIKVDGYTVLTLTSQDTKNGGTKTVFDSFILSTTSASSAGGGPRIYVDDVYFCNGAGSVNNDFLGELRVRTVTANGNGNSSQGTGSDGNSVNNYQLIDDLPMDSTAAATDYVDIGTTDNEDTYTFTDLTETSGTIVGVQITTYDEKTDAGARSIAHVVRIAGTDYVSSDYAESAGSFSYHVTAYETSPATATAWTRSEVNGAEIGFRAR